MTVRTAAPSVHVRSRAFDGASKFPPGLPRRSTPWVRVMFREDTQVGYFDGEEVD